MLAARDSIGSSIEECSRRSFDGGGWVKRFQNARLTLFEQLDERVDTWSKTLNL